MSEDDLRGASNITGSVATSTKTEKASVAHYDDPFADDTMASGNAPLPPTPPDPMNADVEKEQIMLHSFNDDVAEALQTRDEGNPDTEKQISDTSHTDDNVANTTEEGLSEASDSRDEGEMIMPTGFSADVPTDGVDNSPDIAGVSSSESDRSAISMNDSDETPSNPLHEAIPQDSVPTADEEVALPTEDINIETESQASTIADAGSVPKEVAIEGQIETDSASRGTTNALAAEITQVEEERASLETTLETMRSELATLSDSIGKITGEREQVESQLEPILTREREIENLVHEIEAREVSAETPEERRSIESERWQEEEKRAQVERNKWKIVGQMDELGKQIAAAESDKESREAEITRTNERIAVLIVEKKRKEFELELGAVLEKKSDLEAKRSDRTEQLASIGRQVAEIETKEQEIEARRNEVQTKEMETENLQDKIQYEEERQQLDRARHDVEVSRWDKEKIQETLNKELESLNAAYDGVIKEEEKLVQSIQGLENDTVQGGGE